MTLTGECNKERKMAINKKTKFGALRSPGSDIIDESIEADLAIIKKSVPKNLYKKYVKTYAFPKK